MAAKFGTSGLRGLATDMIGAPSRNHVAAFARHLKAEYNVGAGDAVYIAWDYRDSSPAILNDVLAGLHSEGLRAITCGAVPTPALAFTAMGQARASIMITGSHIPADRNGIKFYRPDGEIAKHDEDAIAAGAVHQIVELKPATPVETTNVIPAFVQRYVDIFPQRPLTGLRVGVYQHSTVARDVLVDVLQQLGADTTALARSDTFIPVDTEAVSDQTQTLISNWCAGGSFDAIVSADGDGDRPLLADETGTLLRGDFLGLLTARFLNASVAVTPVTSNSGIERNLTATVVRTRVGSPYVVAAMEQAQRDGKSGIIGFEANGGFLTFSNFAVHGGTLAPLPTRDCFLPILAALFAAKLARKPVSDLAALYSMPFAMADRLENFPLERSTALMQQLNTSQTSRNDFFVPFGTIAHTDMTDGLRVTLHNQRIIHLRPSGNAPEFRCYVEAETQATAQALLGEVLEKLRAEQRR
jgi:phosphomannomutase